MNYNLDIYKLTGKGYENAWFTNCQCRYRILKGARNTKKSYNFIGLEIITKILTNPMRNILVIRNILNSNRNSTFATIKKILNTPDINNPYISLRNYFKINKSTMEITYLPTNQKIFFGGMSNPEKITSYQVENGYLTDVYVEEAFEIKNYDDWRKVDGTIRGKLPNGLFHQITFLLNAWNKNHWIYENFFKGRLEDNLEYLENHSYQDYLDENFIGDYGKGLYLHISTYKINEFRDFEIYDLAMQELRKRSPEIYKVEALGMWGNATGATYPEFSEDLIKSESYLNKKNYACYSIGIDTGLSNGEGKIKYGKDIRIRSATSMQLVGITSDFNQLCCLKEYFISNETELVKKTEPEIQEEIINTLIEWKQFYRNHLQIMQGLICVYVDCADIGFRQGLELVAKKKGLYNVRFIPSTKIKIQTRVDFIRLIMAWDEFLICDSCKNLIREIKNSRKSDTGEAREDFDDHAINANEYAWQSIINKLRRWKNFKEH